MFQVQVHTPIFVSYERAAADRTGSRLFFHLGNMDSTIGHCTNPMNSMPSFARIIDCTVARALKLDEDSVIVLTNNYYSQYRYAKTYIITTVNTDTL
jgi:hypothetical protein